MLYTVPDITEARLLSAAIKKFSRKHKNYEKHETTVRDSRHRPRRLVSDSRTILDLAKVARHHQSTSPLALMAHITGRGQWSHLLRQKWNRSDLQHAQHLFQSLPISNWPANLGADDWTQSVFDGGSSNLYLATVAQVTFIACQHLEGVQCCWEAPELMVTNTKTCGTGIPSPTVLQVRRIRLRRHKKLAV